jgi:hypothetical protein
VLPLERLTIDGPVRYLKELCDFIGIGLSDHDIDRFVRPQNVRMSRIGNIAAELLPDDRFFAFYSNLEQSFGRERVQQFLDAGERAAASLEDDDLADLRERAGPGNRMLTEEYGLELERFGYALAAAPLSQNRTNVQSRSLVRRVSTNRLKQLQVVIDTQRRAHANQIADTQTAFDAERDSFVARIRELEGTVESERGAYAGQIAAMQMTFDAERQAFVARIQELDATLQAEHDAFVARIRELENEMEGLRAAQVLQIADMQRIFEAERQAFVTRIQKLEANLQAERFSKYGDRSRSR